MIREIFVPLTHSDADAAALDAAATLAAAHSAHVTALVTLEHPIPLVTEMGYVPVEMTQQQMDDARAAAAAQAEAARSRLQRTAISSEVRLTEMLMLWSEETAALHARHADISVLGKPSGDPNPHFALTFNSLLLHSGRPVLVVPAGSALPPPLRRVVLAWKPTREATRALHDALPLLAQASRIDVVMIDPRVAEAGHGEQPGADIARHLARHGLTVNVVSLASDGRSIGANLLRHVRDLDADLLVMGGYGHARWREVILGGATRSVLDGTHGPILFAH